MEGKRDFVKGEEAWGREAGSCKLEAGSMGQRARGMEHGAKGLGYRV